MNNKLVGSKVVRSSALLRLRTVVRLIPAFTTGFEPHNRGFD